MTRLRARLARLLRSTADRLEPPPEILARAIAAHPSSQRPRPRLVPDTRREPRP